MTTKSEVCVGDTSGHLTVEAKHPGGLARWVCRCVCGNTVELISSYVANHTIKSCGCLRGTKGQLISEDLTGRTFGLLTVLRRSKQGAGLWFCRCTCGSEKAVSKTALARGATKSCGCLKRDKASKHHYAKADIK